MFNRVVEPYISRLPEERTAWIGKVLSGQSEADVMLFHDKDPQKGFIITPDSKWDGITAKSLYLLVLVMDGKSIRCLRDLRGHHLGMLQQIREKVLDLVPQKYPFVESDQLRLYIHYFPSYFHFHIHVVHADYQGLKGMVVGQSHLLEDVMENLASDPLYYTTRNLNLFMADSHDLYQSLAHK
jgi:m7GpppX diphosphatase